MENTFKKKIAFVLIGHYRSFDKNYSSLQDELKDVDVDYFFHTWNLTNAKTNSYYGQPFSLAEPLSDEQKLRLKMFDSQVEIEDQIFSTEELEETFDKKPYKAIFYLFAALKKSLLRIALNNPIQYDYIVVSRYDVNLQNLRLNELDINPGEIKFGARHCVGFEKNMLANDILYAFNPKDLCKFIELNFEKFFRNNFNRIKAVEEIYTLFFEHNFESLTHVWEYGQNFLIIR